MRNLISLFAVAICISCSTKNIEGQYKSKFRELNLIDFYINLNCDGTANTIYKEQGKEYETPRDGKWIRYADTILISYDSVPYQIHSSQKLMYKLKKNKLIYVAFSKASFEAAAKKMKDQGLSDTLRLDKYKMFESVTSYNEFANKTPIDFKNTYRSQVYLKQTEFKCP